MMTRSSSSKAIQFRILSECFPFYYTETCFPTTLHTSTDCTSWDPLSNSNLVTVHWWPLAWCSLQTCLVWPKISELVANMLRIKRFCRKTRYPASPEKQRHATTLDPQWQWQPLEALRSTCLPSAWHVPSSTTAPPAFTDPPLAPITHFV